MRSTVGHSGPVLQRLGDEGGGDALLTREIGDGAGQLQHAVVGTRRESHLAYRLPQQHLSRIVEGGVLAQLFRSHVGIGQQRGASEARGLDCSRALDALPDGGGAFAGTTVRELLMGDARDVEVDIDAVQEWAADPLLGEVVNWVPRCCAVSRVESPNNRSCDRKFCVGRPDWV